MNNLAMKTFCGGVVLFAATAFAQDTMPKKDAMPMDGSMKKEMTMQQCKDHMAMVKKDSMNKDAPKKDAAMMKHESMCADMLKKDGTSADRAKK